MSLKQIHEKIKSIYDNYINIAIWLLILILSLINSFIFGFLYKNTTQNNRELKLVENVYFVINKEDLVSNLTDGDPSLIVASKNGTKYYFNWCSGINRIKEENRIYFESEEKAREEGYEIASGCK